MAYTLTGVRGNDDDDDDDDVIVYLANSRTYVKGTFAKSSRMGILITKK